MLPVRLNLTSRVAAGQRIAAIDELKGLAIVLIMLYHCGAVLGYSNDIHGEIGVDIFLILSGFTLAVNSAAIPLREFFLRRFLRIYPSYWLALGFCVWMLHHFYGQSRSWDTIIQHAIGVHGFSRLAYFADISDPFWFISLILAAYLVFACIRSRLDDLSLVFAVAGFLTLIATVVYQDNGHAGGMISLAVRIPSFFAGVIAGRLLGVGTGEIRFNLLLGLGLVSFYYLTFYRGIACNYTLPAIGIVLTWIGLRQHMVKAAEGRFILSSLSFLGLISYEIYLFHQPFVRDYNLYLFQKEKYPAPTEWQIMKGIFTGLGATLIVSIAVHAIVGRAYSLLRGKPKLVVGAFPA
jgi:peptidoglycan/LPS O-acetylase OafA/YrhL